MMDDQYCSNCLFFYNTTKQGHMKCLKKLGWCGQYKDRHIPIEQTPYTEKLIDCLNYYINYAKQNRIPPVISGENLLKQKSE